MPETPKLAAVYARLSVDDVDQTSIQKQVNTCQAVAQQKGYTILPEHLFRDDGYSGSLLERPGLTQLMVLVRSQVVQALFVYDRDRLTREPAHGWFLREELQQRGMLYFIQGSPVDPSAEGEVKEGMLDLFAKYERVKIKERMRGGAMRRAGLHQPPGAGRPMGGAAPFGYRYVPDRPERKGYLEPDPEEAPVVRRIFEMCLHGMGVRRIARALTQEHILSRADRALKPTSPKRLPPGTWPIASVHRILRNRTYTGTAWYNKTQRSEPEEGQRRKPKNLKRPNSTQRWRPASEWLPIPVPQIIPPEMFEAAQRKIAENAIKKPRSRRVEYLFLAGRLKCGRCGQALSGYLDRERRWYRCTSQTGLVQGGCRGRTDADEVERLIWDLIETLLMREPEAFRVELQRRYAGITEQQGHAARDLDRVKRQMVECDGRLQRLLDLYMDGHIDRVQFAEAKADIDQKRESFQNLLDTVQTRVDRAVEQQAHIESAVAFIGRVRDEIPRYTLLDKRRALEAFGVFVVYLDAAHLRVFFNLPYDPPTSDLSDEQWDVFRWKGPASLSAISWDEDPGMRVNRRLSIENISATPLKRRITSAIT